MMQTFAAVSVSADGEVIRLRQAKHSGYLKQMEEMSPRSRAAALRRLVRGATPDGALAFFDRLPPAGTAQMIGAWTGSELKTGHPFNGLLEGLGWHGKRCRSAEEVDPFVFSRDSRRFLLNPAFVPLGVAMRFPESLHNRLVQQFLRAVLPLLRTSRPQARLRMMEFRKVVTATMCYDALPVNDHFRLVDADTVLGAMDLRGDHRPFLFVLRREL